MNKKIGAIISSIIIVVAVGLLITMKYKGQKTGEESIILRFGETKVDKVISPEQEGNTIISKQLGFKFIIPEGYELTQLGSDSDWDGENSYMEFSVVNYDKEHTLNVLIIPMDGDSFKDSGEVFDAEILTDATFQQVFLNYDSSTLENKDFCGLPCSFYDGEYNKERLDGTNWHLAEYCYLAPYAEVVFMVIKPDGDTTEMDMLYNSFENLN